MNARLRIAVITACLAAASSASAQIVINEVATGNPDYIEIKNLGAAPVDISGWEVFSFEGRGNSAPCAPATGFWGLVSQIVVPIGTVIPAGGELAFVEYGTLGNQPTATQMNTGNNIFFFEVSDVEVWIEDDGGVVVDYVVFGDIVLEEFVSQANVPVASLWSDTPVIRPRAGFDLISRVLPVDSDTALDWEVSEQSASTQTIGSPNLPLVGPAKAYGLGYAAAGNCAPLDNYNHSTALPTLTLTDEVDNDLVPGGQIALAAASGMTSSPLVDLLALSDQPLDVPLPLPNCQNVARLLVVPSGPVVSNLITSYDAYNAGEYTILPLPSDPSLSGQSFYFQSFFLDLAQPCLLRATQGLEVRIQ
ncbi:MAG: lamin tail domain-containing protein [Planctomycetes bacterium]|nr:lamin tail domain-containing protein [Planctomycetota bacterium]